MKRVIEIALILLCTFGANAQSAPNIHSATLGEANPKTPEISTDELRHILADKSASLFDVRPSLEFSISHIPSAVSVSQKPGTSKALYISDVAEIGRILGGDKSKAIVLYCNGPFCGKSKRVSEDLIAAGFTSIKRYQLGMPVWRALGGVSQIEAEGVRYVSRGDKTAVWLDTRSAAEFAKGSVPGAKRIGLDVTRGGKDNPAMQQAKNDGTLPVEDHNTRIIVFGDDLQGVQAIAEALAQEAFDNVAFFPGKYAELAAVIK
jgi:rhodanese-related sulfurtransferase